MSRVINTNSPGKVRNRNKRTIAEILRRVSTKTTFDGEVKDMSAALVYSLREIHDSTLVTIEAWEKRGYWMKADRFMREWEWSNEMAANLEDVLRNEAWDLVPGLLGELSARTADVQVKNMTRTPSHWRGAYQKLLSEPPSELPY
ncbi:MAG: hypothetical protein JSW55_13460 [Chloroflexota bacterium]|nr:MAG: hypothetical protein JSW55_13460 [Chloroflexota bacterium]